RITLPVERAPPDPPRAPPLERVGHATPRRVSVELRVGAPPGILPLDEPPAVFRASREVVPRARLQDEDPDSAPGELGGHDAARRPGSDDADLRLPALRGHAATLPSGYTERDRRSVPGTPRTRRPPIPPGTRSSRRGGRERPAPGSPARVGETGGGTPGSARRTRPGGDG